MSDDQPSGDIQTQAFTVDSWLYGFSSPGAASCEAENMTSIYDEDTCLEAWYTNQFLGASLDAHGNRFTTDNTLVPGCSLLNNEIVFNRHGTGSYYDPDGTASYYDPLTGVIKDFVPRDAVNPTGYTNGPADTVGFDTPNHPTFWDPPSNATYGSNRICQYVPRHTVALTGHQYGGTYRFCFKGNGSSTYTDMGDDMALTVVTRPTLPQKYGVVGRTSYIRLMSQGTTSQHILEGDVVALIPGANADCARAATIDTLGDSMSRTSLEILRGTGDGQFATPLSLTARTAMTLCFATGGHIGSGGDSRDDWTSIRGPFSQINAPAWKQMQLQGEF